MPLPIENYCPFGCQDHELDGDTGYCKHLVGFTNDKKTGELLERIERKDRNDNLFYTFPRVTGRKVFKITASCQLVNPEITVQSQSHKVAQKAHKWLSWRVYNQNYQNRHFLPADEVEVQELAEFDIEGPPAKQPA